MEEIVQTHDGYLWIGTRGGLARFDGVRFEIYDRRNQPDWASDNIGALHASRDGGLWVGTFDGGLLQYRDGAFTEVPLPSAGVRALRESRDGTLWVAMNRGLARLRPGQPAAVIDDLATTYVYAILEDPDGTLWLGTSAGLYRFGRRDRAPIRHGSLPQDTEVTTLVRGSDQVLWAGTMKGDVYRLSGTHADLVGSREGVIWQIIEDHHDSVWVASDRGLLRAGHDGLDLAVLERALAERVVAVFEDREGSLWAGTRYSGLVALSRGRVTTIGDDLQYPSVLTVREDSRGDVWFGTAGGGLGRLRQGRLETFGTPDGLTSDLVGPIIEDRQGRIWFGPRTGDRLQWIENDHVGSRPLQGSPISFHEDLDGSLWIGTYANGLYRLTDGQLTNWTPQDGLPSRAVRWITDDGEGGLWLATPRGLVRFRERPTRVYTAADGLASDWITSLYREPGGPLWVGTFRGGLARFENGRFTNYGPAEGLCDNQVFAILDDRRGNLWMSSSRGIFHVPKQELNDLARGTRASVSCTAYGRGDGMESAECNGGYQPAAWRARDGRLWFPTVKGLAVVDPAPRLENNTVPPPVWIEAVQADGRSVPLRHSDRLPAGTRRIEINYTALSLVAPDKVLFRHRLTDFDDQWVDAGTLRRVSYTHLPPGGYRFEVIARNNDGVWNEQGDRFDFSVAPFFYQTRWFYGAIGLLVVATGWGLHALRVRDLRMRNATLLDRAALSQEIHDHISQIMTGIGLQLDAATQGLAQGSTVSGAHLERANRLTRQGIEETRLILCNLQQGSKGRRPASTQIDEALVESIAPLIEGTGVRLRARRKGEPFFLPPVVKDEVFHVGQEAVTNALRHAQPREIDIVIAFEETGVRLTVEDDGRGFEPRAIQDGAGEGLGLAGMAARVARQHGTFDIRSRPGEGTTVAAFFPRNPRRKWA